MDDLKDYSGELHAPRMRLEEFTKEALIRLITQYAKLVYLIDGTWFSTVSKKVGEKEAFEWEQLVWAKVCPIEWGWFTEALNIHGNDVASVLKLHQACANSRLNDFLSYVELKSENHGIITFTACKVLEQFEERGKVDKIQPICQIDIDGFIEEAKFINPDIKLNVLKLPPRNGRDEVACIWELKLGSDV
ncbi:DUF6125 family protein [Chloroflexota bacterium]